MEFFFAVFFLLFYYLRPQDWIPGLAGANLVKPIIGAWVIALVAMRSRQISFPGFVKTPHDWIILAYFAYVAFTAPDFYGTFMGFLPFVAFYALTVQSVNTLPRLLSYFKWWNGAMVTLALLGVLSLYGIDPTGAKDATAVMADRLCLGTWLHDNPNALGHTVVVAIPVSYLLFFWRGSFFGRFVIFPALSAIVFYCLWETESKGSYLVGGMLVSMLFVIGRPKFVQAISIATALTLGVSALSFLPRMSQMSDLRADEGVQGRLLAWEMARTVTKLTPTGEGWGQFQAYITWSDGKHVFYDIPKSTHSSYVKIGADLGKYGLFLFLGGLWVCIHTLIVYKPTNETEDRCRRILWILIAGNIISNWMINREYHTEYFLIIAATAALHRLRKGQELKEKREAESTPTEPEPETALETAPVPLYAKMEPDSSPAFTTQKPTLLQRLKPLWNRFGIVDAAICAGLTWLTFWTWDYILDNL